MKILYIITISVLFLFAAGCSKDDNPVPDNQAVTDVIHVNLEALQDENLDGVKETTHSKSNAYDASISFCEKLFERYDLKYELVKCDVEKISGDTAYVNFIQVTKKVSGPVFRDNQVTGTHTLLKDSGKWKIYSTRVTDIKYL